MKIDEVINAICDEGRPCIECGMAYWRNGTTQYFHAPDCQHGFGLTTEVFQERLAECAEIIKREERPMVLCPLCGKPATGTFWVAYHNLPMTLECKPVCDRHADEMGCDNHQGREFGFIPGIVTRSYREVDRILYSNGGYLCK